MSRYRTLADDVLGRWKAGEVGVALPNDMPERYEVKLDFGDHVLPEGSELFGVPLDKVRRVYYFYAGDTEIVE